MRAAAAAIAKPAAFGTNAMLAGGCLPFSLGLYIGLGGVVTFKNARHSLEVARSIPLDRLLTETDAPYMSPVPFRGKRCDSTMIPYDAAKIAEVRGITAQEVLRAGCENACRLFNLPPEILEKQPF